MLGYCGSRFDEGSDVVAFGGVVIEFEVSNRFFILSFIFLISY